LQSKELIQFLEGVNVIHDNGEVAREVGSFLLVLWVV